MSVGLAFDAEIGSGRRHALHRYMPARRMMIAASDGRRCVNVRFQRSLRPGAGVRLRLTLLADSVAAVAVAAKGVAADGDGESNAETKSADDRRDEDQIGIIG